MTVKPLEFGTDLPRKGDMFLRMKNKGDSITFRIAQNPVYTGKHFVQKEGGWDVLDCPRINGDSDCEFCELYFIGMAEAKKAKAAGDTKEFERVQKEAKKSNVSIEFYFPILNRLTEDFAVLQTTYGVRNEINRQFEAGVKVFDRDWTLVNTGSESPRDRYSLVVVDSADSKPLTDKEKDSLKEAKEYNLNEINSGQATEDEVGDMSVEAIE